MKNRHARGERIFCQEEICMCVTWVVLLAVACSPAFKFSGEIDDKFYMDISSSVRSHSTFWAFQKNFHCFLSEDIEVAYIKTFKGSSVALNPVTKDICLQLETKFNSKKDYPAVTNIEHYYLYANTPLDSHKYNYLNNNGSAIVVVLRLNIYIPYKDLMEEAIEVTNQFNKKYADYSVIMTGKLTSSQISDKETGKGFAIIDGKGLPFIVLIF